MSNIDGTNHSVRHSVCPRLFIWVKYMMMSEMTMLKKVAAHIRRYNPYSMYAAKSELKGEVGSSYLTWLWWILDPVLFMLVYVFITVVVFKSQGKYLPVVVIIGLTVWNFFNKTVMVSVKIVNTFRGIVSKIYIPKYMLILENAYRIPPTLNLLWCIPVIFLTLLLTFACSVLVAHFGVYINDLYNVVQVILRFMFYLSGVFYDVGDRLSQTTFFGLNVGRMMITVNPVAYVIDELRKIIIYGQALRIEMFLYWLLISLLLLFAGLKLMYRFENSYIKVV